MSKIKDWLVRCFHLVSQYFISTPSRFIILFMVLILLGGSASGYVAWKSFQNRISSLSIKLHKYEKGKIIGPGTVVAPSEVVSKAKFKRQLELLSKQSRDIKKLIKELRSRGGQVVTKTKVKIKVITKVIYKDKPSDSVLEGLHLKKILTKNKLHIATVKFNTKDIKQPWSYETYPLRLRLHIFHSVNKNKPDRVGVDVKILDHTGRKVSALIINSKTSFSYPKNKLPRWSFGISPFRLELFGLIGTSISRPSLSGGFGLSSHLFKLHYGSSDVFRFAGLGVGYNNPSTLHVLFYPVSYNLGFSLPFVSDLFLSAGVGAGLDFSVGTPVSSILLMIGIGTTL